MNKPILDPRTKQDIMELVRLRAGEYVPEWRYEQNDQTDPGSAIASLFGELFYQTVDRFNLLPQKHYTEFLNLLGVPESEVTPASGLVEFEALGSTGKPVPVPKGTEVFAPAQTEGDEDVIFATQQQIEVTTARLQDIYYVDPADGRIERLDLSREQPFFAPSGSENIQCHRFAFCENRVLALEGECEIQITLRQSARFMEQGTAKLLADPDCAVWRYYNGEEYTAFDSVHAENGVIHLIKKTTDALLPEEDGNCYLYCDVSAKVQGAITLSGIELRSSVSGGLPADALSNNDIPIPKDEGGYCFGHRPAAYGLFYIRSDKVFCKRGADVAVKMDIVPVIYSSVGKEPQYNFNKRIIDKNAAVQVTPEDVFVEQVVWEYYNGSGWAKLPVSGNVNPFSCKQTGTLAVFFKVPADMDPALINAEEGYYIRARVVNVENYLSTIPRWIIPFVKGVVCDYKYSAPMNAQRVRSENNGKTREIADAAEITDLGITVYEPLQPHPRAMYLRFDESPHAMPLSMLFQVAGDTILESKIVFEAWIGDDFHQARAIDKTDNLRYSGIVFLYVPDMIPEAELFGEKGHWLRMSLSSYIKDERRTPRVNGIRFNIVDARQEQHGVEQYFSTEAYEAGKIVELLEKPVLTSDVWVDEIMELSTVQIDRMEKDAPMSVRIERVDGNIQHCWVRWSRVQNLILSRGEDRVYQLDACAGSIRFGNGSNGKVPPRGDLNIRVAYTYGGGVRGNLPEGRVNSLVGSVPRITGVTNIVPMSGGTDQPAVEKIEQLGNKCIRHRGRALGTRDFEQMALLKFERAAHVKCFSNTDETGAWAPGHVCLVVMGRNFTDERMRFQLCREIYEYLAKRCDCNLIAGNRLHVVPSTEITVNVRARVQMWDLDRAAVTQQQLIDHIEALINKTWRSREIGNQIDIMELYQSIRAMPNVRSIEQVLCEGSYFEQGRRRLCALDEDKAFPFATVQSGTHTIRVG